MKFIKIPAYAYLAGAIAALSLQLAPAAATPANAQLQSVQPRIIGGDEAAPGAWPWMAGLVLSSQSSPNTGLFCGGTLIDPNWVLTAGHCADDPRRQIDVVLGTNDLKAPPATYERIRVSQVFVHPEYNPITYENDLALLRLSYTSTKTPIPSLVTPANESTVAFPGVMATVCGWGDTNISPAIETYPSLLMEVDVPIISNTECRRSYGSEVTDDMLCAGYSDGGKDACYGDSGGPLMVPDAQGGYALAGIVSWGTGCALARYYGVYTRVSSYIDWISSYVALDTDCGDVNGDGKVDDGDFYAYLVDIYTTYYYWATDCWWTMEPCGDYNGDARLDALDWEQLWKDLLNEFWNWFEDCWVPNFTGG